jgi:hypothetical protein
MDQLELLTYTIGGGFAGTWMMMFYVAKTLKGDIASINARIDKLEEKLTDIDRRVCRIEGSLMNKECCMLKHDHKEKAE